MSDDLAEIRRGVEMLMTSLALHDQKVDSNVRIIADSQERVATAIEKIGDATAAIRGATEAMKANGSGRGIMIDKKDVLRIIIGLVLAAVAAGAGAEGVKAVASAWLKLP